MIERYADMQKYVFFGKIRMLVQGNLFRRAVLRNSLSISE